MEFEKYLNDKGNKNYPNQNVFKCVRRCVWRMAACSTASKEAGSPACVINNQSRRLFVFPSVYCLFFRCRLL